jgi:hypothetical protein
MDMKKTVKKMSAILAGATMIGATVMGAMAYDLTDYPSPFIQDGYFTGKIVVGEKAMAQDIIGAADIAAGLQASAVTAVSTGGSVSVAGGKTEEIEVGGDLTEFGTLDNNDLSGLKEGTLTIDIDGVDDDYDWHEELSFTSDATIDSGLTAENQDEDLKDGIYLFLKRSSIKYNFIFDDALGTGNFLSDATDEEPITLEFLGKELEVIGATATALTVQVGETVYLEMGQKVTVAGKEVTLVRVGDTSAIVSVGGSQATINAGSTKSVGGLRVKVKDLFNDEGVTNDAATLIVGEESTKTYTNGMEFIGQNKDDPEWVWVLSGLNTSAPTLGVEYNWVINDINDDPKTIGESLSLPNNYAKIQLVGLNQAGYQKYTVTASSGERIWNAAGTATLEESAKLIVFTTDDDDGFAVPTTNKESNKVALNYNGSHIQVFYRDAKDANKWKFDEDYAEGSAAAELFTAQYGADTEVVVGWDGTNSIVLDLATDVMLVVDPADDFAFLGDTKGDTGTTGDLLWGTDDISGWEEDTLTPEGVILHSYDDRASSDEWSFSLPKDIADFRVNVAVVGGTGSVSRTAAGSAYTVNKLEVGSAILDKDATSLLGNTPLIVVGGPSVNTVAATLMGNPTREQIVQQFQPGIGKIKLYTAQNALLVAGYNAQDTLGAAYVLAEFEDYDLTGTEVEVVVPSLSSITVRRPQ